MMEQSPGARQTDGLSAKHLKRFLVKCLPELVAMEMFWRHTYASAGQLISNVLPQVFGGQQHHALQPGVRDEQMLRVSSELFAEKVQSEPLPYFRTAKVRTENEAYLRVLRVLRAIKHSLCLSKQGPQVFSSNNLSSSVCEYLHARDLYALGTCSKSYAEGARELAFLVDFEERLQNVRGPVADLDQAYAERVLLESLALEQGFNPSNSSDRTVQALRSHLADVRRPFLLISSVLARFVAQERALMRYGDLRSLLSVTERKASRGSDDLYMNSGGLFVVRKSTFRSEEDVIQLEPAVDLSAVTLDAWEIPQARHPETVYSPRYDDGFA